MRVPAGNLASYQTFGKERRATQNLEIAEQEVKLTALASTPRLSGPYLSGVSSGFNCHQADGD